MKEGSLIFLFLYVIPTIITGLLAKLNNVYHITPDPFPGELVFFPFFNIVFSICLFVVDVWYIFVKLFSPVIDWIDM